MEGITDDFKVTSKYETGTPSRSVELKSHISGKTSDQTKVQQPLTYFFYI